MIERILRTIDPARYRKRILRKLISSGRVEMGRHTYGVPEVHLYDNDDQTRLLIGNFCSIAAGVNILLGGNHPTSRLTTFPIRPKFGLTGAGTDGYPSSKGDVRVGHDVWIGFGATIVSGVEIGNGAVVAAGSVVVANVPPYAVVGGNPAKLIRMRFSTEISSELEELRWWDWSDEMVSRNVSELCAVDATKALSSLKRLHK